MTTPLTVRPMQAADIPACCAIINHIIELGGTTAYETPYTAKGLHDAYLIAAPVSHVVLAGGRIVGFQSAFDVGGGDLSIGSFTDQKQPVRGAGRALIKATRAAAKAAGFKRILAKITADNASGLAYYSAVGFEDIDRIAGDATRNGKPVDRLIKAMIL